MLTIIEYIKKNTDFCRFEKLQRNSFVKKNKEMGKNSVDAV